MRCEAALRHRHPAVAIAFMHAYRYPAHEARAGEIGARSASPRSRSATGLAADEAGGRGDTTVVDAYLSPILRRYVDQVAERTGTGGPGGDRLHVHAVERRADRRQLFQGKDAILSGPAGGVVGMVETERPASTAHRVRHGRHLDRRLPLCGSYERAFETEVAGVRMRAPMMRIPHGRRRRRLDPALRWRAASRSAPESAGANPGARLLPPRRAADRHRLQRHARQAEPAHFPASSGRTPTSRSTPKRPREVRRDLAREIGDGPTPEEVAEGFLRIAVENMANAIKKISVQRGYDVTGYALNCFGGAGGQHACLVADALGMKTVLIHPYSRRSVGLRHGPSRAGRAAGEEEPRSHRRADRRAGAEATAKNWKRRASRPDGIATQPVLHVRYDGTDTTIEVAYDGRTSARRRRISRPRTWRNSASPTRRAG
jgi:5-oxoprolinase (ATP-hydrolysing)